MSQNLLNQKPLSLLTVLLAGLMITIPLYQRIIGIVYLEQLNWVDGTTIIMVGILLVRGVVVKRSADPCTVARCGCSW